MMLSLGKVLGLMDFIGGKVQRVLMQPCLILKGSRAGELSCKAGAGRRELLQTVQDKRVVDRVRMWQTPGTHTFGVCCIKIPDRNKDPGRKKD